MESGNRERPIVLASLLTLMLTAGCGGGTTETPQPDSAAELPAGHPPLDQTIPQGMVPSAEPGYMLLGAIAEGPDANWFFKLTGPQGTVKENRKAFETMIGSLRAGEAEGPVT